MIYLDTSALVKLVLTEAESKALSIWLDRSTIEVKVSSEIVLVELPRAVARSNPAALHDVARLIESLQIVPITPQLLAKAATVRPPQLRSLDAVHLTSASKIANRITAFLAYDQRLAIAAENLGLPVVAPR